LIFLWYKLTIFQPGFLQSLNLMLSDTEMFEEGRKSRKEVVV